MTDPAKTKREKMDSRFDKVVFIGPFIHSLSLDNLEIVSRAVLVVSKGKIVHVQKEFKKSEVADIQAKYNIKNVYELKKGQFLVPGFVDTHIHAPQYPNLGLGYDLPLLDWLRKYTFPLEKKFKDEDFAKRVYKAVVRKTLANGTTTASYFATIHRQSTIILANCIKESGQRAFVGKVNMNLGDASDYKETYEDSIADTKAVVEYILDMKTPLIQPIITPRFALSCDMKLMKDLGKMASDYNLPIQTHISENLVEIEQVKKEFPNSKNYIGVYDEANLINNRCILAHGVYLEPEELEVIKAKGAAISHCANSNTLLQSGICPAYQYIKQGLKVSLGTDCSGGHSCSMLESIRQTLMLSIHAEFNGKGKKLTVEEVFYMATMGGAEAMCLQNEIGNFKEGKDFDAILVDMMDSTVIDIMDDYTLEELFQKFIYLGDDRLIKKVFVAGRLVKDL